MAAATAALEKIREGRRRAAWTAQAEGIVTKHARRKGRSGGMVPSPEGADQLSLFWERRRETPKEIGFAPEDLPRLWSPLCLAQEMGKGLGRGEILFQTLQDIIMTGAFSDVPNPAERNEGERTPHD